jgi:diacylglycerol kinase
MTRFSYRKFFRSFKYAGRGLVRLIATEQNARVHFIIACIAAGMAIGFHVNHVEAAVLFFAVVLVFGIEITNTAVEKVLDLVHPENHDQIAFVKDALAGAVLIAAIIATVVFVMVFYPYVRPLL